MKFFILFILIVAQFPAFSAQPRTQVSASHSKQAKARRTSRIRSSAATNASVSRYKTRAAARKKIGKFEKKPSLSPVQWVRYSGKNYSIQTPSLWQCIDDKTQLPEKLDVLLIGKGKGNLTPTINIAQEITSKSSKEYIEEILAYHKANEMTLESGIFTQIQSPSGEFTIIKTEKNSSWGRVFCLQATTVIDHTAYIFTSTATLDDYAELSFTFLKVVSSFQIRGGKEATSGDAILEKALEALQNENK
ncbi:hypothetical protein CpB0085 [Chlamydia pneumoniae TW-183]|uniref:Uncharacterized protein n=3 Tax=Chlamydia pneumoniae TaxID=83558 RepID=Q9Z996_CHLPN|nr:hypothetical protein [Chlamydia pneumoniae]AAD18238.1 CT311 hypothetical protein [Chlamydia pneumoniae CWL029]AAF38498.1 conserved hypothetical protein [Chlamydia pneumoniae AR39]AAP98018.1 hypothetical protein CpB0085 [Chlamydia pneumoniae TW-183]CRI32581.1 Uncharacterized protein BN1224_Wien1_A_00880 [Chlamydia pneumoniae]CRI35442.1 Uncharacterized protein BN1224_CM1_A_00890 [Chlamydia pneumoniae]